MPIIAPLSKLRAYKGRPAAALIAPVEHHDLVTELLDGAGCDVLAVEHPDELDRSGSGCAIGIVYIQDTDAAFARTLRSLVQRLDGAPLIVLVPGPERWKIRAALSAGAAAVVPVEDLAETLAPCVHAVRAGMNCVARPYRALMQAPALSTRERQILGLVAMGHTNRQIAERLFLAESTVKSHLTSVFGKLGVRSRNEAASMILDPETGRELGIDPVEDESPRQPRHAGTDAKEVALRLEGFAHQALLDQAARMKVSDEELASYCVLYYLADVDSGRIACSLPRLLEPEQWPSVIAESQRLRARRRSMPTMVYDCSR